MSRSKINLSEGNPKKARFLLGEIRCFWFWSDYYQYKPIT